MVVFGEIGLSGEVRSVTQSNLRLKEAQKLAQEAVDTAIDALQIFGEEADFLRELVAYLVKRNK